MSFQVEQGLLEIAEQVILACGEENLSNGGFSDCHQLCLGKSCCFVEEGQYSCVDDESFNCPVYAGCETLLGAQ